MIKTCLHLGGRPSLPAPETTSATLSILGRHQRRRCLFSLALALSWFAVSAAAAGPPYAFTAPAVEVRTNSVELMAMVVPNGLNSQAWFEWGLVGAMTNRTPATNVGAGFNVVLVTRRFTGLAPSQQYECRVVVSNAPGIVSGAVHRFATGSQLAAWGDSQYTKTEIPTGLAKVVAVAGGWNQSNALKADGNLVAWGDNTYGQTNVPANATNLVGVSGGHYHTIALKADGKPAAWGFNMYGQASVPASATNVVMVTAGTLHSVALKADGKVVVWGDGSYGQRTVPAGLSNVVAVAAAVGGDHNLALRADGMVVAWGRNNGNQCVVPAGMSNVVAVAAGASHSLALRGDGTVVAWGENSSNQCNVPASLNEVLAIAAGVSHSVALKRDGTVVLWGGNLLGQTNLPWSFRNVVAVAAGNDHSLAMGDFNMPPRALPQVVQAAMHRDWVITLQGADPTWDALRFRLTAMPGEGVQYRLYQYIAGGVRGERIAAANTWVSDALGRVVFEPVSGVYGQGYGSFSFMANDGEWDSQPATVVVDIEKFLSFTLPPTEVHINTARLWGLAAPDGLPTWAWFEWGQASGPYDHSSPAVPVGNEAGLARTSVQAEGLEAGGLYQFRLVVSNQLGVSRAMLRRFTTGRRPVVWGGTAQYGQTNVPAGLSNAVALVSGGYHLLALGAQGAVEAWGLSAYGLTDTNMLGTLGAPLAMAAGTAHNLVVLSNGNVVAWGDNYYSQTNVPAGLSNVTMVAAGDAHSLALRADGTVVAWGKNHNGQAGVPVELRDVVAVAAGAAHSVALRGDGRMTAWGSSDSGQSSVPAGLSNVVAMAAGALHNLALKSDGTVAAWGANGDGQCSVPVELTDPATARVVGVEAGAYHSLAILADGTLAGWGQRGWGQLPIHPGLRLAVNASAGRQHSAALGHLLVSNCAPVFLVPPFSRVAECGDTVVFTTVAGGCAPLAYQWFFAGAPLAGATNPILTPPSVTLTQTGNYHVTVMNSSGSITSSVAALTVVDTQPPQLRLLGANPTTLEFREPFVESGWFVQDACDGSAAVSVVGAVDSETPATYSLTYTAADVSGNSNTTARTVVVLPPRVLALVTSPLLASTLTTVVVTNLVRPEPPPGSFRFTLCEAPAGAEINPISGIFRWTPTLAQSHQNFTITVCVTNVGSPGWTTSTNFIVVVDPYLRLSLGTAIVNAGSTGSVPVQVSASTSFSSLLAVVLVSDERLTAPSLVNPANGLPVGVVRPNGANEWIIDFSPGGLFPQGSNLLANLKFVAVPNDSSAFVPLVPSQISALAIGGVPISSILSNAGRVVVNGSLGTGLLEALPSINASPSLTVWGVPGRIYELQSAPDLANPQWPPVWVGIMPENMFTNVILPELRPAPALYFRLRP